MRHLVVPSVGEPGSDHLVQVAATIAGAEGAVVVVAVLPGSLIDRGLPPAERGRHRRAHENRTAETVGAQIARVSPTAACHVVALFGDVVDDTMLVVRNLGADGVVIGADEPHLSELLSESPVPVVVVPTQAEAPA